MQKLVICTLHEKHDHIKYDKMSVLCSEFEKKQILYSANMKRRADTFGRSSRKCKYKIKINLRIQMNVWD
jgi:hypothetical protein